MNKIFHEKTDIDMKLNMKQQFIDNSIIHCQIELTAQFVVAGVFALAAGRSSGVRAFHLVVSSAVVSKAQGGLLREIVKQSN